MRKFIMIISTFLFVAVTLLYTSVPAFASNYVGMNDTVYKSADYWGLEDLPYGVDTGVIQFRYGSNYLTIYFDRLSVFDNYTNEDLDLGHDNSWSYAKDHYWSCFFDNSSGSWDYLLNIVSDSPIYYKKSYGSTQVFSSQIGTVQKYYLTLNGIYQGDFINGGGGSQSYKVYTLTDYSLKQLVGDWVLPDASTQRTVFANCYQYKVDGNNNPYYVPCPAGGVVPTMTDGRQVGYNIKYYPSCEYLQNASIRQQLLDQFDLLDGMWVDITDIKNELYTVNEYLASLENISLSIYDKLDLWLPLIDYHICELLEGYEYDSSQGIGSNTEFGDAAGGLMEDTVVPSVGTDGIVTNLGNSFLFIRNMFDRVTSEFNLIYVISFLLGLSFIAYTLGRSISNKMNR